MGVTGAGTEERKTLVLLNIVLTINMFESLCGRIRPNFVFQLQLICPDGKNLALATRVPGKRNEIMQKWHVIYLAKQFDLFAFFVFPVLSCCSCQWVSLTLQASNISKSYVISLKTHSWNSRVHFIVLSNDWTVTGLWRGHNFPLPRSILLWLKD